MSIYILGFECNRPAWFPGEMIGLWYSLVGKILR